MEEEKERKRQAKIEARAQKRKKEAAGPDPKAKKARKVNGTVQWFQSEFDPFTLSVYMCFFVSFE